MLWYRNKIGSYCACVMDFSTFLLTFKSLGFASLTIGLLVQAWSIHEQSKCLFLNITSYPNHLLLFVKHLAVQTMTRRQKTRMGPVFSDSIHFFAGLKMKGTGGFSIQGNCPHCEHNSCFAARVLRQAHPALQALHHMLCSCGNFSKEDLTQPVKPGGTETHY